MDTERQLQIGQRFYGHTGDPYLQATRMNVIHRHSALICDDVHVTVQITIIENTAMKFPVPPIKWIIITRPIGIGPKDTRFPRKFKSITKVYVTTVGSHKVPSVSNSFNLSPLELWLQLIIKPPYFASKPAPERKSLLA